jgi:glycosyltransferase involved in cell wall biosynthesis
MLNIIWFSNVFLEKKTEDSSGSWLHSTASALMSSGTVNLFNITYGKSNKLYGKNEYATQQLTIKEPQFKGLFSKHKTNQLKLVKKFVTERNPALIHYWGLEKNFTSVFAKQLNQFPSLLEIQGLKGEISRVYFGGLSFLMILRSIRILEMVVGRGIFFEWISYHRALEKEKNEIKTFSHISVPSEWVKAKVQALNKTAFISVSDLQIRPCFFYTSKRNSEGDKIIFVSAYLVPFKGLHDAIRALQIVKTKRPSATLRVIGDFTSHKLQPGYLKFCLSLIKDLALENSVIFLGSKTGFDLREEMEKSALLIMPSHCESCSATMIEAALLNVPMVAAFTGGPNYICSKTNFAGFYPPGDVEHCAYLISEALSHPESTKKSSMELKDMLSKRHSAERLLSRRLDLYETVSKGQPKNI